MKELNPLVLGALIAGLLIGLLVGLSIASAGQKPVPVDSASIAQAVERGIKGILTSQGLFAEVKVRDVRFENGLYEVNVEISFSGNRRSFIVYVSPDAKLLFPQSIDLTAVPEAKELPKTDRPKVELFVMSHCPYGIQMEKALIPVLRLLGDKVDFKLRFVDYVMHGKEEAWENVRQHCIQKLYGTEKLLDYLECYNVHKPRDAQGCMADVNIDRNSVETCMKSINKEYNLEHLLNTSTRFPPFPIDSQWNAKYGVGGSPTLVVNGVKVTVARNPEAIKQLICSAFTTPPPECNTPLPTKTPSPGFGGGVSYAPAQGQCG